MNKLAGGIGIILGIGFLLFSIMLSAPESSQASAPFIQNNQQQLTAPTRNLVLTAAALTPSSSIVTTPAPLPRAILETNIERPTLTSVQSNFTFTDPVPAADSPEFTADGMQACFSAYTRAKNAAENTCKGEWYPADQAPHSYDEYWCATNNGRVGWVPVRFYDGRASETVKPYGSLNQCS